MSAESGESRNIQNITFKNPPPPPALPPPPVAPGRPKAVATFKRPAPSPPSRTTSLSNTRPQQAQGEDITLSTPTTQPGNREPIIIRKQGELLRAKSLHNKERNRHITEGGFSYISTRKKQSQGALMNDESPIQ
jgi:hypothetical protein